MGLDIMIICKRKQKLCNNNRIIGLKTFIAIYQRCLYLHNLFYKKLKLFFSARYQKEGSKFDKAVGGCWKKRFRLVLWVRRLLELWRVPMQTHSNFVRP